MRLRLFMTKNRHSQAIFDKILEQIEQSSKMDRTRRVSNLHLRVFNNYYSQILISGKEAGN